MLNRIESHKTRTSLQWNNEKYVNVSLHTIIFMYHRSHPTVSLEDPDCWMGYLLKARTVEPEKQPPLANDSETTFVSRQWLSKRIPSTADTHATTEELLEMVFSTQSMQKDYKEDNWGKDVSSVWDAVMKMDSWKRVGSKPPFREDLSPEAEGSAR
jgi:hypothetical protein